MKTWKQSVAFVVAMVVVGISSTAAAQDVGVYDWPSEDAPMLVTSGQGLLLLNEEAKPFRAFEWDGNEGDHDRPLRLVDLTGDMSPEILGSGTPTFVTDAAGIPQYSFNSGCRQIVVAEMGHGSERDVICVQRNEIEVYSGSGSHAWTIRPGQAIDWCRAGDLTGTTDDDLECRYARGDYIRLSAGGEVLDNSVQNPGLEGATEGLDEVDPFGEEAWTGEQSFDLSGDGQPDHRLVADGSVLRLEAEGADDDEEAREVEVSGEIAALGVKDFGGDVGVAIVVLTDQELVVIREQGESVESYSARPGDYQRKPHAEYTSLRASGFGEEEERVLEMIEGVRSNIAECYGERMRSAPFAGSGVHNIQVELGDDGSAQLRQRRSDVDDERIEACANAAIEAINFPAPENAPALVVVNITFSFVDEAP